MSGFATRDETLPPAYSQALETLSIPPLWTALHVRLPKERVTTAVPHRWSWRETRPLVHEAARLVPIEQAERRVLVLENPGPKGTYSITATLYAWLQVILPGETAPSHHHTPSALRLIVDTFVAPPWHWIEHDDTAGAPAALFSFNDEPAIRTLGLWREERR